MKKIVKYLLFSFLTLMFSLTTAFAQELDLDTLGKLVLKYNPNAESFYVVGKYVFTMKYVSKNHLQAEDLMIAARSIDVLSTEGEVKDTTAYTKMTVYQIISDTDDDGNIIGWSVGKNFVGSNKISNDAKFEIKYIDYEEAKNIYTVTFKDDDKVLETQYVLDNENAVEPQINGKEGYTFLGWYKCTSTTDCSNVENEVNKYEFTTPVTEDITLKAKWEQNKRIAHFKGIIDGQEDNRFLAGKEVLVLSDSHKAPEEYQKLESQTGYTFKGWTIENGNKIDLKGYIFTRENTTVTGTWESNKYTVTFDSDGGDKIGERIVSYNSPVQTSGEAHKNGEDDYNGYEFIGWFKCTSTTDCSNVETDETAYDFNTPVTENITLKAKYQKIVYTNKMVNNFVDSINNKEFSATVQHEENKISFNIINKDLNLQTNYSTVKKELEKVVKAKNVTNITIEYNDNSKKIITLTSSSNIDSELKDLFNTITNKDFNNTKLEDLYNKSLKVTVNLAEGYKNEEKNTVDTYNVDFVTNFVKVSNIQELKDNLDKGKEIIVENWDNKPIMETIYIDHDVVIDFRNTTIKSEIKDSKYTFIIKNGKNVSIKDLNLEIDAILPSEYDKEQNKATVNKNTIGIKVEENASLTVNNFNVITNKNLDKNALKIGGEDFNSTNVAINENAAIELHGTLYGSNIVYDDEIYGSPTVLATADAIMNLRGLSKSTYIYNVQRINDTTKGSSDRFEKVEGFIHYYNDYNNSYITFVFYSTTSPQAVFALLYNENIIIPKIFQEGGELYELNDKTLEKWASRNFKDYKTSEQLQEQKIKNHETIYLYAKYEQ